MTGIRPAVPQLVALAAAMRDDWRADDLDAAVLAALQANWEWEPIAREVWRLLWMPDSSPSDLRARCRIPVAAPAPGATKRGAALARELLEHRNDLIGGSGDAA